MSLSTNLQQLADDATRLEAKLDRVVMCAYTLCRTLGYIHGHGDTAQFIGPPTIPGFVSVSDAVAQLMAALATENGTPTRPASETTA